MEKSGRKKNAANAPEQKGIVVADRTSAQKKEDLKKRTLGEHAAEIFFGLLYSLWGYVLGGCALPFGATPFGIALLCASESRTLWVFVGLCLSAIGRDHAIMHVAVYSAILLIRLLVRLVFDSPWEAKDGETMGEKTFYEARHLFFNELLSLRMSSACVGALALGVYFLVRGGFLYYDLYGALLSLIVAPMSVAAFVGMFGERRDKSNYHTVGFIALSAALVYATRDIELYHVSAAAFGALFASLYLVRKEGTVKGVLAGAVLGLCYSPALAPLFAFGALCGGIVFPTSVTLGTVTTFAVGTAWAFYVKGIGALSGLLPAIISASVVYAVVDKLFLTEKSTETNVEAEDKVTDDREDIRVATIDISSIDSVRLYDTEARIKSLCESFNALSGVFESMGEMMRRPSEEDLRRICDNAFDSSCTGCMQKDSCWDRNYRKTESEVADLCAALHRDGSVNARDVSTELVSRCARLPDILDEINHNASAYTSRILQYDKTEIFANDYATVSDILAETMAHDGDEYECDMQTSERLCKVFNDMNTGIISVAVWGKRKRRVALKFSEGSSFERSEYDILRKIRELCGMSFEVEKKETLEDGTNSVVLCGTRALSVSYAMRTQRADGENEYCGDTAGVFYDDEDRFYAFISDGMGAGRDAALTSGVCALFLKKMLSTGNGCEGTLRMINGFLRNKGSGSLHECSATVDLWELDLLSGRASFCKSGAAPTYILREGGLFKVRSKTLPVGILREPDTKRIGFDVGAGDVVVMVSDGITQGKEECPWLFDLLRGNVSTLGIEKTADLVVNYAKNEGSTDDLSVLILKIDNA